MIGFFRAFYFRFFFSLRNFALGQQSNLERLGQIARADIGGRGQNDKLFRLAVFVSGDGGLDRVDSKKGFARGDAQSALDRIGCSRATLRGVHALAQPQLHKIVVFRQQNGRAADVSEPAMQSVSNAKMRRWIVGRKNRRAADRFQFQMSI